MDVVGAAPVRLSVGNSIPKEIHSRAAVKQAYEFLEVQMGAALFRLMRKNKRRRASISKFGRWREYRAKERCWDYYMDAEVSWS